MQPTGMLYTIDPQIVLLGRIPQFDWQNAAGVVPVQWSLFGMGRYKLQLPNVSPDSDTPPNTAMDIYIDK